MKYFVTNNNLENSDIVFEAETERSRVKYYAYDEDTLKSNPSIEVNHKLTEAKIVVVKLSDDAIKAANEIGPFVKKIIKFEDACINEFMRTLAIIVKADKIDVVRLACEIKKIKYTIFDSAKGFIRFDEALADID